MADCLLYIISPTHILSSFSALKSLHGTEKIDATILVHWPGVSSEIVAELRQIVSEMSVGFPFISNIIALSTEEMERFRATGSALDQANCLKAHLRNSKFTELFYAHNIEGGMFDLLRSVFPDSKKICIGDTLGNVYEKNVVLSLLQNKKPIKLIDRIKQSLTTVLIKDQTPKIDEQDYFRPDAAALILPVDQSGHFLHNVPLTVCSKQIVQDVLKQCTANVANLQNYIRLVLKDLTHQKKYLLLTDNFSEGNFIDFNREIDMYCSIIKDSCTPGSTILLKSHPGETLPRNECITSQLGSMYQIIELEKKFKRYPIELWQDLVMQSEVICMSYPVLSLKYLFNKDVLQPMDAQFVERWFPQWTWASYKNSASLYMEPLKNLSTWNGNSVLWSGNIKY